VGVLDVGEEAMLTGDVARRGTSWASREDAPVLFWQREQRPPTFREGISIVFPFSSLCPLTPPQFDGTRECKAPGDFNDKLGQDDPDGEGDGEGEDDEEEEELPPPPPPPVKKGAAARRASSGAGPSKPAGFTLRHPHGAHAPPAKRPRISTEQLPAPAFADVPGPPISAAAYRYLPTLAQAPAPFAPGWPPAPPYAGLYAPPPAHEYALPSIRSSAVASYASALARGDVHAAQAASAALYAHGQAPPPPFADAGMFDFEWPEARARAPPPPPPSRSAGGPVRTARASHHASRGGQTQAHGQGEMQTDPTDLSWLDFLADGGTDGGAALPDSRSPEGAETSVNDWLARLNEPPRTSDSRPGSSSHRSASFLPSPVHSEPGGELS
jgi:hypothetical protein